MNARFGLTPHVFLALANGTLRQDVPYEVREVITVFCQNCDASIPFTNPLQLIYFARIRRNFYSTDGALIEARVLIRGIESNIFHLPECVKCGNSNGIMNLDTGVWDDEHLPPPPRRRETWKGPRST